MHLRNFFNCDCVSAALQRQTNVFDAKFVKEHIVLFKVIYSAIFLDNMKYQVEL